MKILTSIFILCLITHSSKAQAKQTIPRHNISVGVYLPINEQKKDSTIYNTSKDTLLILAGARDTLKYTLNQLKKIMVNHSELTDSMTQNPDLTYYSRSHPKDFVSEVGQDEYYMLYAYFLQQRNGIDKYEVERKRLIEIYDNINFLFQHLQYGGTYFGNQYARILAYAEFSIYLYIGIESDFSKTYSITKQKELYIQSLRQIIQDDSKIDYDTVGKQKIKRNEELNKTVDRIGHEITGYFYLRQAQNFQYDHYEHY
jgi:hypothetical protein